MVLALLYFRFCKRGFVARVDSVCALLRAVSGLVLEGERVQGDPGSCAKVNKLALEQWDIVSSS